MKPQRSTQAIESVGEMLFRYLLLYVPIIKYIEYKTPLTIASISPSKDEMNDSHAQGSDTNNSPKNANVKATTLVVVIFSRSRYDPRITVTKGWICTNNDASPTGVSNAIELR